MHTTLTGKFTKINQAPLHFQPTHPSQQLCRTECLEQAISCLRKGHLSGLDFLRSSFDSSLFPAKLLRFTLIITANMVI